jgi:hypothetical protein
MSILTKLLHVILSVLVIVYLFLILRIAKNSYKLGPSNDSTTTADYDIFNTTGDLQNITSMIDKISVTLPELIQSSQSGNQVSSQSNIVNPIIGNVSYFA